MASTLEEANDYVVLNMEEMETNDDMGVMMINADEGGKGENDGEFIDTTESGPVSEAGTSEGVPHSQDEDSQRVETPAKEDSNVADPPGGTEDAEVSPGGNGDTVSPSGENRGTVSPSAGNEEAESQELQSGGIEDAVSPPSGMRVADPSPDVDPLPDDSGNEAPRSDDKEAGTPSGVDSNNVAPSVEIDENCDSQPGANMDNSAAKETDTNPPVSCTADGDFVQTSVESQDISLTSDNVEQTSNQSQDFGGAQGNSEVQIIQEEYDHPDDQSDDGVQPIILGGFDDPDSPEGGDGSGSRNNFPILDFSDMDRFDLTGGASADSNDVESFQPQIISVQSGQNVDFMSSDRLRRSASNTQVAMATNNDKEADTSVSRSSTTVRTVRNNRESQESRNSTTDNDPVIILSDEEEEQLISERNTPQSSAEIGGGGDYSSSHPDDDSESTKSAPSFDELQAAIMSSDDPLVRKIARREKLNIAEAKMLAKEVKKYREENNIEIMDSPIETDDDSPESQEPFSAPPLNIISEGEGKRLKTINLDARKGPKTINRRSPEPMISYPAPIEEEPDEITGDELDIYRKLLQNTGKSTTQFVGPPKSRTIRELLYHKEKGQLPPGNYYTYDDCLVREDAQAKEKAKQVKEAKANDITMRMIELKVEQEMLESKKSQSGKIKEEREEVDSKKDIMITNYSKEKTSKTTDKPTDKSTSVSVSKSITHQLAQSGISLSKTNNQEMPPEGGSTIILPDGTTIKMSPQQAFNITSTINVPGSGGDVGEGADAGDAGEEGYEEGECFEVGEEDDLWATHMTCNDCGELLLLDEIMAHMVSQHWENNPSCYKCGTCDAWFFNKEDYHKHMSKVVEKSGDFIKMDKLYKCALCNKYFKDSEFFLKHLHRKHTDVESVGSMKLLMEIQERQMANQNPTVPEQKPVTKFSQICPKPQAQVTQVTQVQQPTTAVSINSQKGNNKTIITSTKSVKLQPILPKTAIAAPPRNPATSMVRDIGVRLNVQKKVQQLVKGKVQETPQEGKIITAPSSDSSDDEIPGDQAEEPKIKQEQDPDRWLAALSTGPPPKTIAPQPASPNDPPATASAASSSPSVAVSHQIVRNPDTGQFTVVASSKAGGATMAGGALQTGIQVKLPKGMQGAPIIPAAALRPLLNQARAGGNNMVFMMPNNSGGTTATPRILASNPRLLANNPRLLANAGLRPIRPGVPMTIQQSTLNRMGGINRGGILRTTASNLKQKIAMRGKPPEPEPLKKVPLILQKRKSGRKVNPLLNRSGSPGVFYSQNSAYLQGTNPSKSKDTPIVNEEGFDIPQFIEYNPPSPKVPRPSASRAPPVPGRRRGRPADPNRKPPRRKRRRKGRPRASSDENSESDDEEFDNWLEQVSEKDDQQDNPNPRKKGRMLSRENTESDYSDTFSESQDGSEAHFSQEETSATGKKKNASCNLCPKKFFHTASLHAHMKKEHREELRDTIDNAGDVMLKCQVCDHCFDTVEELNFHSLSHIDNDSPPGTSQSGGDFECQYCSEKFSSEDHLNYHVIMHQFAMEEGEAGENANVNVEDVDDMGVDDIGCDDIGYDDNDNDDYFEDD